MILWKLWKYFRRLSSSHNSCGSSNISSLIPPISVNFLLVLIQKYYSQTEDGRQLPSTCSREIMLHLKYVHVCLSVYAWFYVCITCMYCTNNFRTNQTMFLQVGKIARKKSCHKLTINSQNLDPVTLAGEVSQALFYSPYYFCFTKYYKHSHRKQKKCIFFGLITICETVLRLFYDWTVLLKYSRKLCDRP